MNQTWKNAKKPSFGPKFASQTFFFMDFNLCLTLDIVASYHWQANKTLTWENGKKLSFGTYLAFWTRFGPKFFFFKDLPLLHVRHCYKQSLYATLRKSNERNLS